MRNKGAAVSKPPTAIWLPARRAYGSERDRRSVTLGSGSACPTIGMLRPERQRVDNAMRDGALAVTKQETLL